METQRKKFDGAKINNIDQNIADSIFSKWKNLQVMVLINHIQLHMHISYQTAYLKTYYTSIFLAVSSSSDMDNADKILSLTDSSKEHDIKILQPSINNSMHDFISLSDTEILFGLGAIRCRLQSR